MSDRNLARSADGSVIHRADCRHARSPWPWADRATDDELLDAKLTMGMRVCKVCDPSFRSAPTCIDCDAPVRPTPPEFRDPPELPDRPEVSKVEWWAGRVLYCQACFDALDDEKETR